MSPQQLQDLREGTIGFMCGIGAVAAVAVIVLATLGFFDHGTKYQYPHAAAKEQRR